MPTITDLFLLLWPLVIDLKEPAVREEEMKETMVRGRIVLFSVVLCLGEHKSGNRVRVSCLESPWMAQKTT